MKTNLIGDSPYKRKDATPDTEALRRYATTPSTVVD